MYDNYHYPMGADNEQAPWNQPDIEEMDFEVTVSQTLSRTVTVTTSDYIPGASGVEYEVDDEGHTYAIPWHDDPDTSDTDWKSAYESADFKIQDLIEELRGYVQDDLAKTSPNSGKGQYLKQLLAACDGWIEDDYEVTNE